MKIQYDVNVTSRSLQNPSFEGCLPIWCNWPGASWARRILQNGCSLFAFEAPKKQLFCAMCSKTIWKVASTVDRTEPSIVGLDVAESLLELSEKVTPALYLLEHRMDPVSIFYHIQFVIPKNNITVNQFERKFPSRWPHFFFILGNSAHKNLGNNKISGSDVKAIVSFCFKTSDHGTHVKSIFSHLQ